MKKTFLLALIIVASSVFGSASALATELININTADATLLETLPGIGPVKAQAIVDYRQANGPFLLIADIQEVSGIGPATFANIQALITVGTASDAGNSNPPDNAPPTATSSESSAAAVPNPPGGSPEYLPIPTLRIFAGKDRVVATGADTAFTATVYDAKGNKRDDAIVTWSFGDGMQRVGASILHAFYAPGAYLVIVHTVTNDGGETDAQLVVTAQDASVKISSVSNKGIALTNSSSHPLDISWWKLRAGGTEFKFPEHTVILASRSVTFAPQITELSVTNSSAELLLPSGEVADTFPHTPAPQPSPSSVSYKPVQTVEPALSKVTSSPNHEDALAPAATSQLAAAGAPVPSSSPSLMRIISSPWSYGLLGILVAGGAALLVL